MMVLKRKKGDFMFKWFMYATLDFYIGVQGECTFFKKCLLKMSIIFRLTLEWKECTKTYIQSSYSPADCVPEFLYAPSWLADL